MIRYRRYRLIRRTMAQMPGRVGYPSDIARLAGLDPAQTHQDLRRMRGVRVVPGRARYNNDDQ